MKMSSYGRGELLFEGAHLASTYLCQESLWMSKLHLGYFRTGDLANISHPKAPLDIEVRIDDIYNVGGRSISLSFVEAELVQSLKITSFTDSSRFPS